LLLDSVDTFTCHFLGWLCFTGWQSAITGIGFLVAGIIQGKPKHCDKRRETNG